MGAHLGCSVTSVLEQGGGRGVVGNKVEKSSGEGATYWQNMVETVFFLGLGIELLEGVS